MEDVLIDTFITAAREYVEASTNRALIEQTWRLDMEDFDDDASEADARANIITLDHAPLANVTSIQYYPADGGALVTLDANEYRVVVGSEPGRIQASATGSGWPSLAERPDAVQIEFVAGYGTTAASVPALLRLGVTALAAHFYEQRLPVNVGNIVNPMPHQLDAILAKYRVRGMTV
jgi:uncharacterized phiE125 gp8 family phage protein